MKPEKPYPDFPLTAHSSGQWCKTIDGRRVYFGTDWKKALKKFEQYNPKDNGLCVVHLVDRFVGMKEDQSEVGEIRMDTVKEYRRTCERMVAILGKYTPLDDLTPEHFIRLRSELAGSMSVVTLKGQLSRIRVILNWAYEVGMVDKPLRYRQVLKSPSVRLMRKARAEGRSRLFTPKEILTLITKAEGYMKGAIWLGINCGLGNRDVCDLRRCHIQGRWLDYPRPKTMVDRRSYLWPETIQAIKGEGEYVCAGEYGQRLGAGWSNSTPIAHKFADLCDECKIPRRGFYDLRHTYRTIADGAKDEPAVYLTMGHADTGMGGTYRHRIEDDRLIAVSEVVRKWLLG